MKNIMIILSLIISTLGAGEIPPTKKACIEEFIEITILENTLNIVVAEIIHGEEKDANKEEVAKEVETWLKSTAIYQEAISKIDEVFSEQEIQSVITMWKSEEMTKCFQHLRGFSAPLFDTIIPKIFEVLKPYPDVVLEEKPPVVDQSIVGTEENFEEEVIKSSLPVVVDFCATWCGPCKQLEPVIAELSNEMQGVVKFVKVDADTQKELSKRFKVKGLPTLVFMNKGEVVDKCTGFPGKDALTRMIRNYFLSK